MNVFPVLLCTSFRSLRGWFHTDRVGKTCVLGAFVILLAFISLAINRVSGLFFTNLAFYEQYGKITASYVIHAAIVVTIWIGAASAVTQSVAVATSTSSEREYLTVLPIPGFLIDVYELSMTIFAGVFLLAVVFIPVTLAYARAFGMEVWGFTFQTIGVLFFLSALTGSAGFLLARLITRVSAGPSYLFLTAGFFVFLAGIAGLVRMLFPPALSAMYSAPAASFPALYASLPLNRTFLPTYWLMDVLVSGSFTAFFKSAVFTVVWVCGCLFLARVVSKPQNRLKRPGRRMVLPDFLRRKLPHASDSILFLTRSPAELGYAAFLFSVAAFFFIVLSYSANVRRTDGQWAAGLTVFTFIWMMFFTISFAIRFLFPLMAHEGPVAWHIFTQPLRIVNVLKEKLFLAIAAGIFGASVFASVWTGMPVASANADHLTGYTLFSLTTVTLVITLLGAVRPNFAEGNNPEKVSTSMMGILALGVSVLFTGLSAVILAEFVTGNRTGLAVILPLFSIGGILVVSSLAAAYSSITKFEF